jgi:hypothetical protein
VLEHRIRAGSRLVAEATSVMVSYDYAADTTTEISPRIVSLLQSADGEGLFATD